MKIKWVSLIVVYVVFIEAFIFVLFTIPKPNMPIITPPPTEIHVEAIENNETFNKLLNYCNEHPTIWLMLFVNYQSNNSIAQQRYTQLKQLGNRIGLHVHVGVDPEIRSIPYETQYTVIKYGKDFLLSLNITTTHFAPGYWSFCDTTVKACYDLGYTHFHVWQPRVKTFNRNLGVEVVPVENYLHDSEI